MNVDTIITIVFAGGFALFILALAMRERLDDLKSFLASFAKAQKSSSRWKAKLFDRFCGMGARSFSKGGLREA